MVAAYQYVTGEIMSSVSFPRDRAVELQGPQMAAELAVLSQDPNLGIDESRMHRECAGCAESC